MRKTYVALAEWMRFWAGWMEGGFWGLVETMCEGGDNGVVEEGVLAAPWGSVTSGEGALGCSSSTWNLT